jgi:hypothetical protein
VELNQILSVKEVNEAYVDINECDLETDNCNSKEICVNLDGSFECKCKNGYIGNGFNCYFDAFITTWKTDAYGASSSTQITIPTNPNYTYNYDIDCNYNGVTFNPTATNAVGDYTCKYNKIGTYQVAIINEFPSIYFNYSIDANKILSIDNWGSIHWLSMEKSFAGCYNLTSIATDSPDLSNVTDMLGMFENATSWTLPKPNFTGCNPD